MQTIKRMTAHALIASVAMMGVSRAENVDSTQKIPAFTVDAARQLGAFRPLNSVNGGPRINMGLSFDNSEYFRAFNPPLVRTHDSAYSDLDTCDIHAIFPDFNADETKPENYRFERTDLHLKAILDAGSQVFFRLGESIEHATPKYHIYPPADFKKWARICCNVVRHYNSGWAKGFQWNIKYWEIWNEPNGGNCWAGTMPQFCELYRETAVALKQLDPTLKIGGPGLAGSIGSDKGEMFLAYCRDNKLPLDFVSWHGYSSKPAALLENIKAGMAAVGKFGFKDAETCFGEWNFLPSDAPGNKKNREVQRQRFSRVRGAEGAAFAASMLAFMQDTKLDMACFYAAYGSVFRFGMFDQYGVPSRQFDAFKAFHQLSQCGTRIKVTGDNRETGLGVVAAVDKKLGKTVVLLSNFDDGRSQFNLELKHLPFNERLYCTEYVIDDRRALAWDREKIVNSGDFSLTLELPKNTVRLILFTTESAKAKQL